MNPRTASDSVGFHRIPWFCYFPLVYEPYYVILILKIAEQIVIRHLMSFIQLHKCQTLCLVVNFSGQYKDIKDMVSIERKVQVAKVSLHFSENSQQRKVKLRNAK